MKYILIIILFVVSQMCVYAQTDSLVISDPSTLDLQFLVAEALINNQQIQAELYQMDVMQAKIPQAGSLDDPELKFASEEMPGFNYNQARYHKIELMQTFRFPSKLSAQGQLAEILAEHAHHDHQEVINDVITKLKSAYYELWLVQQKAVLNQENVRLMNQFSQITRTKYGLGQIPQQDVLKAQIELAMLNNEQITLRQQELSAKAMLMAILNRSPKDTLGFAVIPEEILFETPLDSLVTKALASRPMLIHDSLSIVEGSIMLSLARKEYIPDFKIGFGLVSMPIEGINAWSISAGITLPFVPWTAGKANGRIHEAEALIKKSASTYASSRTMVISAIQDLYYKVEAGKHQLENFRTIIIPQTEQSLRASLTAYQTGTTGFLMLIDAYKTRISLMSDYFMIRMQFEQTIAMLERETGNQNISTMK